MRPESAEPLSRPPDRSSTPVPASPPPAPKDRLGRAGEDAAAAFLRGLGYRILGQNLRTPVGEVDILAVDGTTLVVIEVKTRRSDRYGHPLEAVDARRRRRLVRAVTYLLGRGLVRARDVRFDTIGLLWPDPSSPPRIDHREGAFEAPEACG